MNTTIITQARQCANALDFSGFITSFKRSMDEAGTRLRLNITYATDEVAGNYLESVNARSLPHDELAKQVRQAQNTSRYIRQWRIEADERERRRNINKN